MSLSSTTNDPLANVPSDRLWLRSELMGTQVITRDSGRRLGVVGEVIGRDEIESWRANPRGFVAWLREQTLALGQPR